MPRLIYSTREWLVILGSKEERYLREKKGGKEEGGESLWRHD